jgi:hypothetical protein
MSDTPRISICANPNCGSKFMRLGEGRLAVFSVNNSEAWGLPKHKKQKAVWLCNECASQMYVRLDRLHHAVQLVYKHRTREQVAA